MSPIPIPAVQPEELVQAKWERPSDGPYDPSDLLEEAELPFTPASEEPEVTRSTPRESKPKERRPATRIRPVATGPSQPVRVVRRYQPPYPKSARRAGTEGRVLLAVQVRSDGRVGSVRVSESSGSAVLDSAAVSAVK
ncbi:MAG: TonB family protein, partial [Akkermansiaceae bacterium]|nr:TonB family protein [Akkermansiaceae bacterium]